MHLFANRYCEIKKLGSGTTGAVYLVRDEKTGISCALKILHASLGSIKRGELETFRGELQVLKNLNHPSIAKIYDAGLNKEENSFYLVTEFVEGQDLFQATEGKSLEVIEDLFVQSLRALNYLHNQKICHLDIKPQNMLVGSDADQNLILKLIDFGFANFHERKSSLSQDNQKKKILVGTASYMPPEIIQGDSLPDGRSDLYSLGCSFYKAFTRQVPFAGGNEVEIYYKHLHDIPSLPSQINPQIPSYLDKILLKLLEKDPVLRYPSAQAVIEDLNLMTNKFYPVETRETIVSYLPQRGKLVGREKEYEKLMRFYDDRLYVKECRLKPYVIIVGAQGCGKSRFLQECKNEAQKDFIRILSWAEFKEIDSEEKKPTLVIGDDVFFDSYDLESIEVFFADIPILILFGTSKADNIGDPDCIIKLQNFTKTQTSEYLSAATGLSPIPDPILKTIYTHTHGNPLYLTEYVRVLFEKGFLKDIHGSWDPQILEDLGVELENSGATEFIKKRLNEKMEAASLQSFHLNLLYTLALTGKPTLEDLMEMTGAVPRGIGGAAIDENLKFLVNQGILAVDSTHNYSFSNPLFKEVLLEKISPALKSEICDAVADRYEKSNEPQEKVLYYRGRGNRPEAAPSLLELAKIKRDQTQYLQAKEHLIELMNKQEVNESLLNQGRLELGEILIETGDYEEAEKWLDPIISSGDSSPVIHNPFLHAKVHEQLGLSFQRRSQHKRATDHYIEGLKIIKPDASLRWMEVNFKNRMAQCQLDAGNEQEAEKIFLETWQIWLKQLSPEEKIQSIRSDIDNFYYLKGEYKKAADILEEILKVVSQKPSLDFYPITLYKLGRVYIQDKKIEEGEKILLQCLETVKERRTPYWLYSVYNELGNIAEKRKEWEKAHDHYHHAFDLALKKAKGVELFIVAFNRGHLCLKTKKWEEAKKYFYFVIRNFENPQFVNNTLSGYYRFISYLGLSDASRHLQSLEEASQHLVKAHEIFCLHSYLKSAEQYYWQEKADIAKAMGHQSNLHEALEKVEALKTFPGFNQEDYEEWKKGR